MNAVELVDAGPDVLVARAVDGDERAWNQLVERYSSLLWSVCRRFGLSEQDGADVAQTVWLRLVEHLTDLRSAAALPGWIVTTTRRECVLVLRGRGRQRAAGWPVDEVEALPDDTAPTVDDALLAAERDAVVRDSLAQLDCRCRDLLRLLVADPPVPYARIATVLAMPVSSIGPTRGRCLKRLRGMPALARFLDETGAAEPFRTATGGERHE
jgi:RNA polymerase sigma factor (sigma-70 family)